MSRDAARSPAGAPRAAPSPGEPGVAWRIRVRGHAEAPWGDWYEGLRAERDGPDTVLVAPLPDQAALYGLLLRLRDLGLELLGVEASGRARLPRGTWSGPGASRPARTP